MQKINNQNIIVIAATALITAIIILGTLLISNPEMYKGAVYVPYEAPAQTTDTVIEMIGDTPQTNISNTNWNDPTVGTDRTWIMSLNEFRELDACFNNPENYTKEEKLRILNESHQKYLDLLNSGGLSDIGISEYNRKAAAIADTIK